MIGEVIDIFLPLPTCKTPVVEEVEKGKKIA